MRKQNPNGSVTHPKTTQLKMWYITICTQISPGFCLKHNIAYNISGIILSAWEIKRWKRLYFRKSQSSRRERGTHSYQLALAWLCKGITCGKYRWLSLWQPCWIRFPRMRPQESKFLKFPRWVYVSQRWELKSWVKESTKSLRDEPWEENIAQLDPSEMAE